MLLFLLLPLTSIAANLDSTDRNKIQRIEFSLAYGALIPTGEYTSQSNINSAFAKNGVDLNLELRYRLSEFIGIGIEKGFFQNFVHTSYFDNRLGQYSNYESAEPSTFNSYWSGSYNLIGINFCNSINKFTIGATINCGIISVEEPYLEYIWVSPTTILNRFYSQSDNAEGWCLKFKAMIRYNCNKRIDFFIQSSYFFAKPKINQTNQIIINGNETEIKTSFLQPISNFGISAGILIKLF